MGSQLHLLHPILVLVWILCGAADAVTQPNSNCTKRCGPLEIPFPFGTDESCSLDSSFLISCNHTSTPYLTHNNSTVLSISLDGEMRVSAAVARGCYDVNGTRINETSYDKIFNLTHFSFSSSKNKLTVVGCNTIGEVVGYNVIERRNYATGCFSVCLSVNETTSGICTGAGCCQSPIPASGLSDIGIGSYSSGADSYNAVFGNINPCGYAFVAEDGAYNFSSADLVNFRHQSFPVVVDWAVGNQTCEEAQKNTSSYACRADKSECYNATKGLGYVCKCSTGFGGNPYLVGGCQGVSVGVIALLVTSFYVYWRMKEKRLNKLKEQFFQQNGGFILLQKISRHRGSKETAKLFTVEELKTATNNFDESKILGKGGQGTVYRGLLSDNRTVAIKRSKISGSTQIEQFINEVVLLSQINHRNVVRLLGCCLETEVPLLVYEFIPNGTIFEHLHGHNINNPQSLKLSWKTRLRIAIETAGALAYLHSAISIPIIHRDIKTTNILLDANLTAKISDFGASKIVPLDQTELTTLVQGTLGYLDPEYMHTSQLTEKSDVYSFGVVLAELLTGKKALSFAVSPEVRNLAIYVVSSMEEGCLVQIVDEHIINEANVEDLVEFANVAKECLRVKREERPSMKEVAMQLEGLRGVVGEKHRLEETKSSLKASSSSILDVESSKFIDSLSQVPMSLAGGR
ncbi:wall-associated receptor kinase 5-like [Arachis hypogaea]|uniref:wall-associated receptor kinase 5-like n=1 Tax=Arachis hypogaea TaxID=3818 RepID=UPI0010FC5EC7|nr:putative wall-associated receptor kinase-like 16 [Arachis hypogaea]